MTAAKTPAIGSANDNGHFPHAIQSALDARPNSIEAPVLRAWSKREPLDAAMAAHALHRRLRCSDDQPTLSAPKRPDVDVIVDDWKANYPEAVYLPASDRLLDALTRWADEEITPSLLHHS
ncbi:hypothetical protein [Brevundimonas sp. CEF1]|uniref:hypothetical protein n=1 Tax=Brevundimonas sp. CEF1 TaxID=3442642 RepID=UPI003F510588